MINLMFHHDDETEHLPYYLTLTWLEDLSLRNKIKIESLSILSILYIPNGRKQESYLHHFIMLDLSDTVQYPTTNTVRQKPILLIDI